MPLEIKITVPDEVVLSGQSDTYVQNAMAGFFASMARQLPPQMQQKLLEKEFARGEPCGEDDQPDAASDLTDACNSDVVKQAAATVDRAREALVAADAKAAAAATAEIEAEKKTRKPRTKKAETAAADAADEVIDAALNKTPVVGTRAELNAAVQAYVMAHGMDKLAPLQDGLKAYPIENDSDVAALGAATAAVLAASRSKDGKIAPPVAVAAAPAASSSLFDDDPAPTALEPAAEGPTATATQCKEAILAYMTAHGDAAAEAEIPKVLIAAFNGEVTRFTQIPEDPLAYGRAKAAIDRARESRNVAMAA